MTAAQDTVLNVDDQEPQRYIKSRDLRAAGYAIIEARTGAEALRMVEQHKPAAVLLDVQLPDIDGHEVCRYIKRTWPEVMVLMMFCDFHDLGRPYARSRRRGDSSSGAARRAARACGGHQRAAAD